MSYKKESERVKLIQEKCQNLLSQMLKDEDNKYCVDCDAKGPRWASWNLGIFLCIRCAGIHRSIGVHISRVKSVNLDTWKPEQVVSLQQMGNSRARAVYEAHLPDGYRRPQNDSALESFIRAKYEQKKYIAREWVSPPPPKIDWDKDIDDEIERQKRKKKSSTSSSGLSIGIPKTDNKTKTTIKTTVQLPPPLQKINTEKKTTIIASSDHGADLLGLSLPTKVANDSATNVTDNDDTFSGFLSAMPSNVQQPSQQSSPAKTMSSPQTQQTPSTVPQPIDASGTLVGDFLAQEESDFFNQIPKEQEKAKMSKDSILALYGAQSTIQSAVAGTTNANSMPNYNSFQTFPIGGNANRFPSTVAGQPHSTNMQTNHTTTGQFPLNQFANQFNASPQAYALTNNVVGGFMKTANAPPSTHLMSQQYITMPATGLGDANFAQFNNGQFLANATTAAVTLSQPPITASAINSTSYFGDLNKLGSNNLNNDFDNLSLRTQRQ